MQLAFCKSLLILFLSFALSSCGYHLRGQVILPSWLNGIYIKNESGLRTLNSTLENQFKQQDIKVYEELILARYTLDITYADFQQHIISVSSSTTPRQYQLVLLIDFSVKQNNGLTVLPSKRVMVIRQVTINNNRILGSNFEENTIKREMQREAAYLILNHIKDAKLQKKNEG